MSVLGVNTARLSPQAQLKIQTTAKTLQSHYERLASGLRITRPSDDAAGLSVSSKLSSNARVFTRAIQNVNDGISLLNIAQDSVEQLGDIATRLKELAEQAANGVLSRTQRIALDKEGNALTDEYNRIITGTDFNSLKLLDPTLANIVIQAGFGITDSVSFNPADGVERTVGDGTYQTNVSYVSGNNNYSIATADVNGDGFLDIVSGSDADGKANVFLGNGNGTFKASTSYLAGVASGFINLDLGDVNGDGYLDIISSSGGAEDKISILLGNGNGTFIARATYAAGDNPRDITIGDVNGDGKLDIVTNPLSDGTANVLLGNGNGTFKAKAGYGFGVAFPSSQGVALGDVNGDGKLDIVASVSSIGETIAVLLGNGDGSFSAGLSYSVDTTPYAVALADFNFDGILDVATISRGTNKVDILLGNSDGSFKAKTSYAIGLFSEGLTISDLNGDGFSDLITIGGSEYDILLGNGDGTFKAKTSTSLGVQRQTAVGDFNRDGAIDIAAPGISTDIRILLANSAQVTTIPRLNLTTQSEAREALGVVSDVLDRISSGLGALGASQARLSYALNAVSGKVDFTKAALSRITDADVGEESAGLVRTQILQQAQVAVLAQANQTSKIILDLLQNF